ncbi:MAG: DUF2461 domain-containing protein [Sphingobacteriaceae bacterium]|nr:DUF2461 domain-containing protein [Sphingobacteriaceae bacterium]
MKSQPAALDFASLYSFLEELKEHNYKAWFDTQRERYQQLRLDFIAFVADLVERASLVDPNLAGLEAKNCIFRINRDVRFSANKNPYKTNFSAYLAQGGKKFPGAGYYFHFEPGASFMAAGIWMPEAPLLKNIRQEIDYGFTAFKEIVENPALGVFELESDRLSRPPKGYEADNPAIEFLKLKSFVLSRSFDPLDFKSNTKLAAHFQENITTLVPFVEFLNQALTTD